MEWAELIPEKVNSWEFSQTEKDIIYRFKKMLWIQPEKILTKPYPIKNVKNVTNSSNQNRILWLWKESFRKESERSHFQKNKN